jgi:hypothetical protein
LREFIFVDKSKLIELFAAAPMPGFGAGGQTTLQGEVNKIVESMSPSQLYEIMTQMKVRRYFLI